MSLGPPQLTYADITIISGFTGLSTLASMIEQVYFATSWAVVKEAEYHKAVKAQALKGLAIDCTAGSVSEGLERVRKLLDNQLGRPWLTDRPGFFALNVMAWNLLFW